MFKRFSTILGVQKNFSNMFNFFSQSNLGQIQLAVNKQSKDGWSPLIVAASRGHVEAVQVTLNSMKCQKIST